MNGVNSFALTKSVSFVLVYLYTSIYQSLFIKAVFLSFAIFSIQTVLFLLSFRLCVLCAPISQTAYSKISCSTYTYIRRDRHDFIKRKRFFRLLALSQSHRHDCVYVIQVFIFFSFFRRYSTCFSCLCSVFDTHTLLEADAPKK